MMIVILCPGYEAAEETYYEFIGVLQCYGLRSEIKSQYDYGLCVTLDDDLTYIFIDEHWQKIVEKDLPEDTEWDYMESFLYDIYDSNPLPWWP